jgi:hypothetical protein
MLSAVSSFGEIEGREFDWFARDETGALALFATAGEGTVPQSVVAHVDAHDAIGDAIPVFGWGTSEVWQSYAAVGLYAYNWDSAKNRYCRVAIPEAAIAQHLEELITHPHLPAFSTRFQTALELSPEELQDRA